MDFDAELSSPKARGQRLKELRLALRLSRKALGIAYALSPGTLQNWEDGRFGGLTEKGAKKIIAALTQEGLECKLEWLMYGVGSSPKLGFTRTEDQPTVVLFEEEAIARELELFYQHNPGAISTMISDNSMEPYLFNGDHVAGRQVFGKQIQQLVDHDCIVQTTTGQLLVRKLMLGQQEGTYNLICHNIAAAGYTNIKLFSAAAISWIRRKNRVEKN